MGLLPKLRGNVPEVLEHDVACGVAEEKSRSGVVVELHTCAGQSWYKRGDAVLRLELGCITLQQINTVDTNLQGLFGQVDVVFILQSLHDWIIDLWSHWSV